MAGILNLTRAAGKLSLVCGLCLIGLSACDGAPDFENDFESGTEGWQLTDRDAKNFGNVTLGEGGRFIRASKEDLNETWYWRAPIGFHGNLCSYYDGSLTFQLRQINPGEPFDNPDVIVRGRAGQLEYDLSEAPGNEWTAFKVPLSMGAGWLGDPDENKIKAVLANVSDVLIRADYALDWNEIHLADVRLASSSWISRLMASDESCEALVLNKEVEFVYVDPPHGVLMDIPAGMSFRLRVTFETPPGTEDELVRLGTESGGSEYVFSAFPTDDKSVYLTDPIFTELGNEEEN